MWLFREKIYFIISDTANQDSWNIHRHHETIMHTWKSHTKRGQADVLQNLSNTYHVRIFVVTLIINRKDFAWYSSVPPAKCQDSAINYAMKVYFYVLSNLLFTIIHFLTSHGQELLIAPKMTMQLLRTKDKCVMPITWQQSLWDLLQCIYSALSWWN